MPDEFVEGCRVIDKARSRDENFPWVVICERPEPSEDSHCFVVWYVDEQEGPTAGTTPIPLTRPVLRLNIARNTPRGPSPLRGTTPPA